MRVDPFETLVADVVRDLGGLSSSAIASQLAITTIVTLGLAETAWIIRRLRTPAARRVAQEAAVAAAMGLGGLVVGVALAGLFVLEFELAGRLAPSQAIDFWQQHPALAFVAAFAAWDLAGYFYHRIGHRTAIGWAAHRPHHTGNDFTLTLAWRQSWLPVHAVVLPLVAAGGWSLSTIVVCAAISNVLQALQHSSAHVRYPRWIVAICMTPIQHRHHHAVLPDAAAAVNLGPVFTIWDRLAGSYVAAPNASDAVYGVASTTSNPLRLQFEGWRQLAARLESVSEPVDTACAAPVRRGQPARD